MKKTLVCLSVMLSGVFLSDLRAQPSGPSNPPPTTQAIQQSLDAKQYTDVLKESQRVLQLKGPAAKGIDRYSVLMMRAEAQLQLKQQSAAVDSYRQAAKETTDPTAAGMPKAMIVLIQNSRAFMYTPKPSKDPTKPASPLSILDEQQRKQAMSALFEDEWTPTQAKIEALKKRGTSLPPILQAADLAGEMRGLEIAATGKDTQTSTALADLTDTAAKLMTDYLDRQTKEVDNIEMQANRRITENINDTSRTGLSAAQGSELKDTIATCEKLTLAAQQVANSAGSKGSVFQSVATRSAALEKKADTILNTDYSAYNDPNANRAIIQNGQQGRRPGVYNR